MNAVSFFPLRFHLLLCVAAIATAFEGNGQGEVPQPDTKLGYTANADSSFALDFSWRAVPGAAYFLQARTGLASNTTWETIDLITSTTTNGYRRETARFPFTGETNAQEYFRVVPPQPAIVSVEPAIVSISGGTIYLLGQLLGTNVAVRFGGLTIPASTLTPGSTYSFVVPAGILSEGVYDLEVLEGTNVVAFSSKLFSVTGQPTPVGEAAQRLWEPPFEPPASPSWGSAGAVPPIAAGGSAGFLMKAKEKANRTKCQNNFRVFPPTGEVQWQECDLWTPGRGLDFAWTRTYRSRTGTNTSMGQGWSHCYDARVFLDAGGVVIVLDGAGREDRYFQETNGVYTANELFNVLYLTNGIPTLEFPDTGKWEFNSLDSAIAPGKLSRIVDRNGNALTCGYDSNNRLIEVVDTLGRTNYIAYDAFGRVSAVTDFSGRACTYTYWRNGLPGGGDGDLRSVTSPIVTGTPNGNDFPSGKTSIYTYTKDFSDDRLNHNLLTCTDPAGQVWLSLTYASTTNVLDINFDRVAACARGADAPTMFTYTRRVPTLTNRWAVMETVCNDPAGNVSIEWSDSLNRCVVHRDLAARAAVAAFITSSNLPTVQLRSSDPDYWETRCEWNADSLCTRIVYPGTNSTEMVYQRAYNQNNARSNHAKRRSDGDARVIRELSFACDGGASQSGDCPPQTLVTRFDYDPRFGSPAFECRFQPEGTKGVRVRKFVDDQAELLKATFNGGVNTGLNSGLNGFVFSDRDNAVLYEAYTKGLFGNSKTATLPTFTRGYRTGKMASGFVTGCTDPEGNRDTCSYDTRGNRTVFRHLAAGDSVQKDFEYNSSGQITAIINAADASGYRRRDEFTYFSSGPRNGYCRTWVIDATGPTVRATSYDYDAAGNLALVTDPLGNTQKFHNNTLNQVVLMTEGSNAVCNPCGTAFSTAFFYDANDNLMRRDVENRDATGGLDAVKPTWTTLWGYDSLDRCTMLAHELTHVVQQGSTVSRYATNRFVYDGNGNVIEHDSPEAVAGLSFSFSKITYISYDTRDRIHTVIHSPGSTASATDTFDYAPNGGPSRDTIGAGSSEAGVVTTYEYDGFDRLVSTTDPMGNQTIYAYDRNGNPSSQITFAEPSDIPGSAGNLRFHEWRWKFDSLNRMTSMTEMLFDPLTQAAILSGQATTSFAYAPNGMRVSMTDPNGHTTRYAYDTSYRLTQITDAKTNLLTYVYDANNHVIGCTQSDRSDLTPGEQTFVTHAEFDALGRCVASSDNVGNTNRYAYDSRDNLLRFTDPRGNDTCYTYDGLGRQTAELSYVGSSETGLTLSASRMEYSDNSRLTAFSDGNSNSTRYAYDPRDRCVGITNADNTVESLIWSPRSNLSSRTDPNGTVITCTYDDNDNCVGKDILPGPGVAPTTTYEIFAFDGMGQCVMASNNLSLLEFSHDSQGNLRKGRQDGAIIFADFDNKRNRVSIVHPHGRVVSWTYDSLDEVSSVSTSAGSGLPQVALAAFAYDGPGRPGRVTRGSNPVATRFSWDGLQNPSNAAGDFGWQQINGVSHQIANGGAVFDRRISSYDRNQNKISRLQLPAAGLVSSKTNTFSYDALDRLAAFTTTAAGTGPHVKMFALDSNGNRQSIIEDGALSLYSMDHATPEPADFQMDQYTVTPFGSEVHDHNGNLIQGNSAGGDTVYAYDYADRLVAVEHPAPDGSMTGSSLYFSYDALGRRISKTMVSKDLPQPITTTYVLDPMTDQIIEEQDHGVLKKSVVFPHALEVSGRIHIADSGQMFYSCVDELGTALALLNAQGAVIERYDYDAYGAPTFLTSDGVPMVDSSGLPLTQSPNGNDQLFRGLWWDSPLYCATREPGKISVPDVKMMVGTTKWKNIVLKRGLCSSGDPWSRVNGSGGCHYIDPATGRSLSRQARTGRNPQTGKNLFTAFDENPWSPGREVGASASASTGKVRADKDKIAPRLVAAALLGSRMSEPKEISAPAPFTCESTVVFPHVLETSGRMQMRDDLWPGVAPLYYEQSVITAREAGSGMATGRRSYSSGRFSLEIDGVMAGAAKHTKTGHVSLLK